MARHPSQLSLNKEETVQGQARASSFLFMNILCAHACGDFGVATWLTNQGIERDYWPREVIDQALLRYDQKNR
jgi:hypothetical protein